MNPIIPFASNVFMPLFPMILISITTAVVMIAIAISVQILWQAPLVSLVLMPPCLLC